MPPPSARSPDAHGARPAALTLHLHGVARVVVVGGDTLRLERRAAALCALAALEPGFPRERAAAWLWPDSSDPRRNLRQQLLRFKQQLGRALLAGDDGLVLAPGVTLAPTEAPLLDAMSCDELPEFALWLDEQRRADLRRRSAPLRAALQRAEAGGDLDAALQAATRLVALEPHSEEAGRELMRIHFLRNEPAAGLAAFERLRAALQSVYATEPAAATRELAEALRRGAGGGTLVRQGHLTAAPRTAAGAALPVTLKRPPVLTGRDTALAATHAAWSEGLAVLLEGEAGLGKSRLVAELTAGGDALVAAGRPGDGGTPYATLARWLAPLLAREAPDHEGRGHPDAAASAALACIALGGGPAAPDAGPLKPGALQAAVDALLERHDVHLLALDDLQFADAATLELAAGLAALAEPPRRWLFAQRPAEAAPAARALRDDLAELQRLVVVTLEPLSEPDAAAFVDTLGIPGLDGAVLAPALVRHTGGNPLFLLETLRQGLLDGSLARGRLPRPATVGVLIERRLQRLSEPAIALARVAAIAGVDFSVELAEAVIGCSAVQLAGAWQELQAAQVLRDEDFAHDLVADAALASVPPVVARRVHALCARWLAEQGAAPARVARHWLNGGAPAEAGRAFVAAARRAQLASRAQEEAALYAQAAAAFDAAGLPDERFDALADRVVALIGADFGDIALQEVRALVDSARSDRQRLRALHVLAGLLGERSQSDEAVEVGRQGLALARRLDDQATMVRIACPMAGALCRLGRADEALGLLLPLRAWVDVQDDDHLRMLWHGDWAATLGHAGRLREAVAAYDMALAASRRIGRRDAEGRLLMNCAVTLRQGGQLDRALAMAREGRALAAGDPEDATHVLIARLVVARDESETGQYAPALATLEALLPGFEAAGAPFWWQAARLVLAQLWLHLGQPARAVPLLRDEPAGLPPWLRADRRLLQAELAAALRQPTPHDLLQEALELAETDPQRGPGLRVRALRHAPAAQVLAQADALAHALAARERFGALAVLHAHLARAALEEGRRDEAAAAARRLLERLGEGCAPEAMYRGEAWWLAGRALEAAGAADEAARTLAQGTLWVTQTALPQVPPAFIESFLQRNAVNRALLAAARHRDPGP